MGKIQNISYLFETSWEVCNKVGGIYTVVSTKLPSITKVFGDHYILIGPDVWKGKYNQEFIEDRDLYSDFRKFAEENGIYLRIGRWNMAGRPIVILLDFMSLISQKDRIFGELWNQYHLDSISGQWDYVEPALFGYGAGKLIDLFYQYHVFPQDKVYAHFHEWMTGSGILYLKQHSPQIATVFTTHATALGRCIAGNNLPLYADLATYQGEELADEFGIKAKFSLEKLSALHADAFTTVSEITNNECKQFFGKPVDVLTPNGFEPDFVPKLDQFEQKRTQARAMLKKVGEALTGTSFGQDALYLISSGRYEFRNKGIDLFIESLSALKEDPRLNKNIIAYITVPADHGGARSELLERMEKSLVPACDDFSTHYINGADYDPIIRKLRECGLRNLPEDKVKVIFVPCYLDGRDGIFNLPYYDLLIGFDASVFPSYYEPWGYTPLESIAFRIPTLTTSLAGFGLWIRSVVKADAQSVCVVDRNDFNDAQVVHSIKDYLFHMQEVSEADREMYRTQAWELSKSALWSTLSTYYEQAYAFAAKKWEVNKSLLNKEMPRHSYSFSSLLPSMPQWKKFIVKSVLPEKLKKLGELSQNLWWSWDCEAQDFFASIDPALWKSCGKNPVALLQDLSGSEMENLLADKAFLQKMDAIYERFKAYMNHKSQDSLQVAYFSMEFGLHQSLQIYSGGLGILAGDYLKAATDKNVNMIGVGLLYRYGYFKQKITEQGEQQASYVAQAFSKLPIQAVRDEQGQWKTISISLPGRRLTAKIWRVEVGRIPLYLLDTDIPENTPADRSITHQLYGGDWENRLKQELLLGVGGVRMLRSLQLHPQVYHCNEGHAAFMGLERLREYIENEGLPFMQAKELVRSSALFTTHTPVPAGHDTFSEDLLRVYLAHYPNRLRISWTDFMSMGRSDASHREEKFSMSFLAAGLSQEINGVSRIHGRVSKDVFAPMFFGYMPNELPIGYVTNGVHYKTWAHELWQKLHAKYFGEKFFENVSDASLWANIQQADEKEIWQIREQLRKKLIDFIKLRLAEEHGLGNNNPKYWLEIENILSPTVLTIGFARRFATYKRAYLLFKNLDRLKKIVNHPDYPVQFVFAGKAHPADKAGQDLIKQIVEISQKPEFFGKIIFLENYDIEIAKKMVQGVDIWMNTPTRPLEASGTSGEKAIMNGVLNLSVLDGWWAEGYKKEAGWALAEERKYQEQSAQDTLDAETIYRLLESEIVPAFYRRTNSDLPSEWIGFIKKNFSEIAPHFTIRRQLDDYYNQYYHKLNKKQALLHQDHYAKALELSKWKLKILNSWEKISVLDFTEHDATNAPLLLGDMIEFELALDLAGLEPEELGVEVVFGRKNDQGCVEEILFSDEMLLVEQNGSRAFYKGQVKTETAGVFDYSFRLYPKHTLLEYRQDFKLVKWI